MHLLNTMVTRLFLIAAVLLSGCASTFSQKSLSGNYYAKGKDYAYELKLSDDSSFQLTTWHIEVKSTCEGSWQTIKSDTILLLCSAPKPLEELQGGYMSERERKVAILRNRKLKMGNIELKRVK